MRYHQCSPWACRHLVITVGEVEPVPILAKRLLAISDEPALAVLNATLSNLRRQNEHVRILGNNLRSRSASGVGRSLLGRAATHRRTLARGTSGWAGVSPSLVSK